MISTLIGIVANLILILGTLISDIGLEFLNSISNDWISPLKTYCLFIGEWLIKKQLGKFKGMNDVEFFHPIEFAFSLTFIFPERIQLFSSQTIGRCLRNVIIEIGRQSDI